MKEADGYCCYLGLSPVKTFIHPTNKSCIPIQISKYFSKQEITINPLIKYSLHNETLRTRLEYLKTRNMELPSLPEFSRAPRSDTTDYGSPTWMPDGHLEPRWVSTCFKPPRRSKYIIYV